MSKIEMRINSIILRVINLWGVVTKVLRSSEEAKATENHQEWLPQEHEQEKKMKDGKEIKK